MKHPRLLALTLATLFLASCGGGAEPPVTAIETSVPRPAANAATVSGGSAVAVHMYQALYGLAPSNASLNTYTAQATADPSAFARNLANNFASTSSTALAKLVLDNLGVTAMTVLAVNGQGQSEYAILLDALGQMFTFYGPDARGQIILNATNLLAGLESDSTYGVTAVSYNNQATANFAYSSNSANTVAAIVSPAAGTGSAGLMGGAKQGTPLSLSGVVSTFAGVTGTSGVNDGTGTAAKFDFPSGITTDATSLYSVESNGGVIRKISIASSVVTTLAKVPGAVDITSDGTSLFVADSSNHVIKRIDMASGVVSAFAGLYGAPSGSTDGTGTAARFKAPLGITSDGKNLYVADSSNYTIRKIDIATGVVSTLAGTAGVRPASGTTGLVDGIAGAAKFYWPKGLTTDGTHLYVCDNGAIRKIAIATGAVSTMVLGAPSAYITPVGVTTDGVNLYVSDNFISKKIHQVVIATGIVSTLAGSAYGAIEGAGAVAKFGGPIGITTDGKSLYVTDSSNHAIRKIQ